MIHHLTRATRHLIFWSLLAVALGLTGVRLVLLEADRYKTELATQISALVEAQVSIGHIGAKMRGFSPELVLKDIKLSPSAPPSASPEPPPALVVKEMRLGVRLLDMLLNRELLPSMWVTLVGTKLSVKRQADGQIVIEGLKSGSGGPPLWILQGSQLEILDSVVVWHDEQKNAKPLTLEPVDMAILNQGDRHKLNAIIKLPHKQGDKLTLSMDLTGNIFEPATVSGKVYVEGKAVNLAHWVMLDQPLAFTSHEGQGDFRLWAELKGAMPQSVTGDLHLQSLKITRADQKVFAVKNLDSLFRWQQAEQQWSVVNATVNLETEAKEWDTAVLSAGIQNGQDGLVKNLALYIDQLELEEAAGIAEFFAPLTPDQAAVFAKTKIKGSLEHFSLFSDLNAKTFAVNGEFNGLSISSSAQQMGVDNLSGSLNGTDGQGWIDLATQNGRFIASAVFREALALDSLKGSVNWQQTQEAWLLSSVSLALVTQGFDSNTRLQVTVPKTDAPVFMNLQTAFTGSDVSQVVDYLPARILSKDSMDWLDYAFVGGKIKQGGFLFRGNVNEFPFTKGQGVFEVLLDAEQVELAFHPQWPHLTGLAGEVMFLGDTLQVNLAQGSSNNVAIKQAEVRLPSLSNAKELLVKGELEGEIGQALDLLQKSSLDLPVDALLNAVTPEGSTQIALDLKIPLSETVAAKVDGSAKLSNAKLRVKPLDLLVSKINGDLKFNTQGVYSDTINAEALGYPIRIKVDSDAAETRVNVGGHTGIKELEAQFDLPIWRLAKGATDYQLQLKLPYGEDDPELHVESALIGVALDLPASLAKTAESGRALNLTFNLASAALLPISINYDQQLKAALAFDVSQKRLVSGHILVGEGEAGPRQEAGLKLEINHERLALDEWLAIGAVLAPASDEAGTAATLNEIKLHSPHILWKKSDLGDADVAMRLEGGVWAGTINSAIAKGKLTLPGNLQGNNRIHLDLDTFNFSALRQLDTNPDRTAAKPMPETMPLITLNSKKTLWKSQDLGAMTLVTERAPDGIVFKSMAITGDTLKFTARGDWKLGGAGSSSSFQGHVDVPKAGILLAQTGISRDWSETAAVLDFAVNWKGAPQQFSFAGLEGQLNAKLSNGRILSIEPGFGRVLGMLALAQWIKRLQLDFSDVYKEGLSFNNIKGHFDFLNGKAVTRDLVVDAIPAKISISGEIDLVKRTVDHIVNVAPKSADAVPIAGTIMGKVSTLIARTLTGKDQEGFFFGSQYLVKGPWDNAQVLPLHDHDGLLQKTWNSLTDFSWLIEKQQ